MNWNFPAAARGTVTVSLRVLSSGVRICLCDHWYNACDETVGDEAPFVIDVTKTASNGWTEITFTFDTERGNCTVTENGKPMQICPMRKPAPYGLCYLHIQTLADTCDYEGALIRSMHMNTTI